MPTFLALSFHYSISLKLVLIDRPVKSGLKQLDIYDVIITLKRNHEII
jgi:hypothetical protein